MLHTATANALRNAAANWGCVRQAPCEEATANELRQRAAQFPLLPLLPNCVRKSAGMYGLNLRMVLASGLVWVSAPEFVTAMYYNRASEWHWSMAMCCAVLEQRDH